MVTMAVEVLGKIVKIGMSVAERQVGEAVSDVVEAVTEVSKELPKKVCGH